MPFLGAANLDTSVIFIPAARMPEAWGDTTFRSGTDTDKHFFSVLVANWDERFNPDPDQWARTTAHEFYHCVLRSTNPPMNDVGRLPWNLWWIEGGAAFFGTALFPEPLNGKLEMIDFDGHPAQAWFQTYNPTVPFYMQGYGASLFHLDLYTRDKDQRSLHAIHGWFARQVMTQTASDELARIAGGEILTSDFEGFAKRFTDDRIKKTRTSPTTAKALPVLIEGWQDTLVVQLAEDDPTATWRPSKKDLVNYGFLRLDIDLLAPDKKHLVTYEVTVKKQAPQTKVFYRLEKDVGAWKELARGSSFPDTVGCKLPDKHYILLFVSTDSTAKVTQPKVVVARTDSTKCPCKTKASRREVGAFEERQDGEPESCPTNMCIDGIWALDLANLKTAIENSFKNGGADATITSLQLGALDLYIRL